MLVVNGLWPTGVRKISEGYISDVMNIRHPSNDPRLVVPGGVELSLQLLCQGFPPCREISYRREFVGLEPPSSDCFVDRSIELLVSTRA